MSQSISLTTLTPACNANGVVVATFHGMALPITVNWNYGFTAVTHTIYSGDNDTLYGYTGAYLTVTVPAYSATNHMSAPPFKYATATANAACPALGTVTAAVDSGGVAPFSFLWYNKSTGANVGTGATLSVTTGSYGVIITDSVGCVYGSRFNLDTINVAVTPDFSYVINTTTANCNNGSAAVGLLTGGVTPYSYSWSTGSSASGISGVSGGTYKVTVTDGTGCAYTQSATVPQGEAITITSSATMPSCLDSNGTDTITASGGTAPYTYTWSNGATTPVVTGLSAGTYMVTVQDALGCYATHSDVFSDANAITATYLATASSCTAATGAVILNVSSPLSPYTVIWDTYPAQRGDTISGLAPGTYTYDIHTNSGCSLTGTVTIPKLENIVLAFSATEATCGAANGALVVFPVGGSMPYNVSWSTGATTDSISGIAAGNYNVTVTDSLGCTQTGSITLPGTSTLGVALSQTQASCRYTANGSLLATAFGGTSPYTYSWNTGATAAYITALGTGDYNVTVTDHSGCVVSAATNLGYNIYDSSCFCMISGTVYNDALDNCTLVGTDAGIPNVQVQCSGIGYTYTDANGNYSFMVPSGTYDISETVLPYDPMTACQVNNISVSVTPGTYTTVNFADSLIPINDMHISTWDYNMPMPGSSYSQICIITNAGNQTDAAIVAGYMGDGSLLAPAVTPAGFFTREATYWMPADTMAPLAPGASNVFYMNYNVPANIPTGTVATFMDTVAYMAPTSNWATDYTPYNNINQFTTTVTNSSPANFKEVYPKGIGASGIITYADSILEYMIHFQNTSGSMAQNVVITDTIASTLRAATLMPIYESAPCNISLSNTGIATFAFNNINLPAGGEGVLTYTVKLAYGQPYGTQFTNTAHIAFDNTPSVATNTTLNTLDGTLAVNNVANNTANNNLAIFPNPANTSFTAIINSANEGNATMNIIDLSGRVLISNTIGLIKGSQNVSVNVASLASGMYYILLNGNGINATQKLVVTR